MVLHAMKSNEYARITTPVLLWTKKNVGINRKVWSLYVPLIYGVESKNGPTWIYVPRGQETDLASIPWPISMLLRNDYLNPSGPIIHDYLYRSKGNVMVYISDECPSDNELFVDSKCVRLRKFTRKEADKILYEILNITNSKSNKLLIKLMYHVVRVFGFLGWGK